MMTNVEILAAFYRTVWEDGKVDQIGQFFDDSLEADGWFPGMAVRAEDFAVLVMAVRSLVTDMKFTIERALVVDDWVTALIRVDCVSRERGLPLVITGQLMARFANGRMICAYNHMDMIGFFVQLGLIPENLVYQLLTGADAA